MAKLIIDQALFLINSGARVFVQGCGGSPRYLNRLLANRAGDLRHVEIISLNALDDTFTNPELKDSFFVNSLFASSFVRSSIANGSGSYIPTLLSEMPRLFNENILPLDAALIQVSPPDKHGYCSLGISVEVTQAAIRNAKHVFAQINRNMPRVHGDTFVHMNDIDSFVEYDEPLIELNYSEEKTQIELNIGKKVAELIEDQSTLQVGIGPIPDSILMFLNNHKDLSIATEMLSDGVIPLLEKGVITNRYKKFHPGKTTCTFILGTKKLYDFVDDNPTVLAMDASITNDPAQIRQNPRTCAITSALEIDLTGQICSDSLGTIQYSGVGGQMDFMRGAALSKYGKPIIVLPSQTSKGVSRIVNTLKEGAGVTATRAHVHYVATEYGVVNLFGKNYQQRAKKLIEIAHPNHREALERAAYKRFKALY
ncbi:unnamed protein product [Rotaria socialis]|uniref:Acetyl-CoA hydrolase n=1 Tax=Rotaria socialis TaxID=392032 RepID=A0A817WXL5_9BILA|nr:unnamed protein product [Rotaria socialis]CAF3360729.1 unnamed protein product [Rotaria socialis]CAF3381204.1 unnamed protein product [Rotaria socialis]CAF3468521.1 unnamed protein product [Rotaria socialis]CAF3757252.1 unnamed protein product [Rotaria socialis]